MRTQHCPQESELGLNKSPLPGHLSIAQQLRKVKITESQGKAQHEAKPAESLIILIGKHQTAGTDPRAHIFLAIPGFVSCYREDFHPSLLDVILSN